MENMLKTKKLQISYGYFLEQNWEFAIYLYR